MSIKAKLILLTSVFLVILAAIGIDGYIATSGTRDFADTEMLRAMDAADGAMESRINYLHVIWGAMEGAASFDETSQKEAKEHFQGGVEGFAETLELLKRSGIAPQATLQKIETDFQGLVKSGRAIMDSSVHRMEAMEGLDITVNALVEKGLESGISAKNVHLIWAMAMAASDYSSFGHQKFKDEFTELASEVSNASYPSEIRNAVNDAISNAKSLIALSEKEFALIDEFDEYAESLDATMEIIEEGDGSFEGADGFVNRVINELRDMAAGQFTVFMVLAVLGAAISIIAALLIMRSILGPLGRIVTYANEVGGGDLDAQLSGEYAGELGEVKTAVETMVDNLKTEMAAAQQKSDEAAQQAEQAQQASRKAEEAQRQAEQAKKQGMLQAAEKLEVVVERSSSATSQLMVQVDEISNGSGQQRSRIAETATAMEEMNATVLEVARNAAEASAGADDNRSKAIEGKQVVAQTIEAVMEVQGSTAELSMVMTELSSKAESIGQVMTVISDIADQTNLLALNAAIEAARAGEAGRGFAVVADEVRKLAEKTMTATSEVGGAIRGIQDSVRTTATKRETAERALDKTIDLAQNAGNILGEIVTTVETASDMVRAIATAAEEQSATSEEINNSVDEINIIAGETEQSVSESAEAIENLSRQIQELQGLIGELKA